MLKQLAIKVAAKAISHFGRKRNPDQISTFGRKISHTLSRVQQGAEVAGKIADIADTVNKTSYATKNFQTNLDH